MSEFCIKPVKMQQIEARAGKSFAELDADLLNQGKSDAEIAADLDISVNTLKDYRKTLGVRPARCLVPVG